MPDLEMANAKLTHSRRRKTPAANQASESPVPAATERAGGCWVQRLVLRRQERLARTAPPPGSWAQRPRLRNPPRLAA